MSLPDPPPAGKHRYTVPIVAFGLAGLLALAWSGAWVWARGQTVSRLNAAQAAADAAGYHLAWKGREIGGYPFRMDVTLTDVSVREPSGWAVEAPRIEGEAYMHALTHWLVAAPAGLTLIRPEGGPVAVRGELIRASLSHFQNHPPNVSVEGTRLAFAPAPGARPFALTAADRAEFHLRQGPDDEGGVFFTLEGGKARAGTLLGRLAGDRPVAMQWNATYSKASALAGRNWADAVRRWSQAGGRMSVRNAGVTAGQPVVGVTSGSLGVAADGRASGVLAVSLTDAPRVFEALGAEGLVPAEAVQAATDVARARQAAGAVTQVEIGFQAGRTTFGPVSLGPALKVYDPR